MGKSHVEEPTPPFCLSIFIHFQFLGVAERVLAVAVRPGFACSVDSVTSGPGSKPHYKSASTISVLEWLSVGEWIAGHARDSTVG